MQFSAGSVLSRAFSVLLKNFVPFAAIAIVVYAPVIIVGLIGGGGGVQVTIDQTTGEVTATGQGHENLLRVLNFIAQYALAGAVAYGVFQSLKGDSVSMGDCLSRGFQRLLPVIGVAIVVTVGLILGFIALVVPMFILACMWYVAVPVAVVEKPGVFASLSRSSELTRGNRMSIFAMFLLIMLLSFGAVLLMTGILMGFGNVLGMILIVLLGAFFGLYGAVCVAVAYHDLRVMKEGIGVEDLIKVFE